MKYRTTEYTELLCVVGLYENSYKGICMVLYVGSASPKKLLLHVVQFLIIIL